jgi:hypothetical protein
VGNHNEEGSVSIKLVTPSFGREDLSALMSVEVQAWGAPGENIQAGLDKIQARIRCWREGITLATVNSQPIGSQYAFRFEWCGQLADLTSWDELTQCGWYEKIHQPEGTTGFLVGVGVIPAFRGQTFSGDAWDGTRKCSELLIARTLLRLFAGGVMRVIGCARVPGYHRWRELGLEEYCSLRRDDGLLEDPVLRFHERMGARVIKPVADAMEDPESRNAGAWVLYQRPVEWYHG